MKPMSLRWLRWTLLFACCLPLLALAATPRAWLDRDSIRLGESVTLNVETDGRGGSEPDFSALERDFRRLGTSSSTQLSFVNGQQSARTLWAVALEPRSDGVIAIPALPVGGGATAPLTLTVLPMPQGGSAGAGDDVFLEIEAEPAAPYVQQQVRYTVRLYYAVQLLEGQLEEPQPDGVQVRRLGQDVQYLKNLADRRYTVVERRYALLPEASGKLEIPGPQFRGRALRTGGYGSLLSPNAILTARGNSVEMQVRPRPPQAPTPWLPAQSLRLSDESTPPAATPKVGEPLTLVLRLGAHGLAAEQLPELQLPPIDGAEIYPDQESSQTADDGQWLRGERVRKFALVPTRPGPLEVPEIAVEWWNVAQDRAERAVLPARRLDVVAADGSVAAATVAAPVDAVSAASDEAIVAREPDAWQRTAPWAALTFALLWLATLALLLARRRAASVPAQPVTAPPRMTAPDWRGAWQAALARDDLAAAANALILAAQQHDPSARNLGDVAALLDAAEQRDALQRLEHALYREADPGASGAALRAAFAAGPAWRHTRRAAPEAALPPLYPERRSRA